MLDQPTYGGNDYEDGGTEGAVQCEDCCGMYVTGLCEGRAQFDSGKFHNHCTRCPDFGTCIGDYREVHLYLPTSPHISQHLPASPHISLYLPTPPSISREAHCDDCGKHWFAGLSGFACSHCG